MYATSVDERQFFNEKPEERNASYQCTQCRRTNEYAVRWLRRTKKAQPPAGSDEQTKQFAGTELRPRALYENGRVYYGGVRLKF